jgi:hypothetical protein
MGYHRAATYRSLQIREPVLKRSASAVFGIEKTVRADFFVCPPKQSIRRLPFNFALTILL